jgi:hypothetical protein
MDAQVKAKWVEALRSGKFKQCRAQLHNGRGYCCLGVLAIVGGHTIDAKNDSVLRPGETSRPLDRTSYGALGDFGLVDRGKVIFMNDRGQSFAEIADYIEANL